MKGEVDSPEDPFTFDNWTDQGVWNRPFFSKQIFPPLIIILINVLAHDVTKLFIQQIYNICQGYLVALFFHETLSSKWRIGK